MYQSFCNWYFLTLISQSLFNHTLRVTYVWFGCSFMQIKYVSGGYDSEEGFWLLDKEIYEHEVSRNSQEGSSRRLFYLALPPSVYPSVCKMIRSFCMNRCKYWFWIPLDLLIDAIRLVNLSGYIQAHKKHWIRSHCIGHIFGMPYRLYCTIYLCFPEHDSNLSNFFRLDLISM